MADTSFDNAVLDSGLSAVKTALTQSEKICNQLGNGGG